MYPCNTTTVVPVTTISTSLIIKHVTTEKRYYCQTESLQTLLQGDETSSTIMPAHVYATSKLLLYITSHCTYLPHTAPLIYFRPLLLVTIQQVDALCALRRTEIKLVTHSIFCYIIDYRQG